MMHPLGLVLVATVVFSASIDEDRARMALQNPDLFEGDIMGIDPNDRSGVPNELQRWTDKTIPYVIDDSLIAYTDLIQSAMKEYETKTCLKFKKRGDEKNYIRLFAGRGCYSFVGMIDAGKQDVSLDVSGCMYKGTIVHELGHAIGFFHEQNRSDRDQYLIIYWDNIKAGMEPQFQLLRPEDNIIYNTFDYQSIMIYGNYAFSKDMRSMTMADKHNKVPLTEPYEKDGLTDSDVHRVKTMYKC